MLDFSFGIVHRTVDHVLDFDNKVKEYHACQKEAIFIMFIGVVNHWVALVAVKKSLVTMPFEQRRHLSFGQKQLTKFFLLDSSNIEHLGRNEADLPDLIMDRVREKVRVGLKATSKFVIQMSIQSLFD